MLNKFLLFMLLLVTSLSAALAQDQPRTHTINSASIINLGLINGSNGASVNLQAIFGASYHQSFLGIGAGIDYYRYRTIPVFLDVRQHLGKGNRNVFVYGDLGYNYDWVTDKNREESGSYGLYNYKGGIYYDAGLGYELRSKNKDAFLLSLGYSVKKVKNDEGGGICPFVGPCYNEIQTIRYTLSRLVIKAGWKF